MQLVCGASTCHNFYESCLSWHIFWIRVMDMQIPLNVFLYHGQYTLRCIRMGAVHHIILLIKDTHQTLMSSSQAGVWTKKLCMHDLLRLFIHGCGFDTICLQRKEEGKRRGKLYSFLISEGSQLVIAKIQKHGRK